MGSLTKIISRGKPQTTISKKHNPTCEKSTAHTTRELHPLPAFLVDNPPAGPCSACGCPIAWLDVYGGGPHCAECLPPPSGAMVARRLFVVVVDAKAPSIDAERGVAVSAAGGPTSGSTRQTLAWIDWRDVEVNEAFLGRDGDDADENGF